MLSGWANLKFRTDSMALSGRQLRLAILRGSAGSKVRKKIRFRDFNSKVGLASSAPIQLKPPVSAGALLDSFLSPDKENTSRCQGDVPSCPPKCLDEELKMASSTDCQTEIASESDVPVSEVSSAPISVPAPVPAPAPTPSTTHQDSAAFSVDWSKSSCDALAPPTPMSIGTVSKVHFDTPAPAKPPRTKRSTASLASTSSTISIVPEVKEAEDVPEESDAKRIRAEVLRPRSNTVGAAARASRPLSTWMKDSRKRPNEDELDRQCKVYIYFLFDATYPNR